MAGAWGGGLFSHVSAIGIAVTSALCVVLCAIKKHYKLHIDVIFIYKSAPN